MRVNSMFHALVAIVALLTFSTPFLTVAQQNTVGAQLAAEQDASRDIRILFGMVGLVPELGYSEMIGIIFYMGCVNGGIIGAGIGCASGALHGNPGKKLRLCSLGQL